MGTRDGASIIVSVSISNRGGSRGSVRPQASRRGNEYLPRPLGPGRRNRRGRLTTPGVAAAPHSTPRDASIVGAPGCETPAA
jgi:hypothetical protein